MSQLPSIKFRLFGFPVEVQLGFLLLGLLFSTWVDTPFQGGELLLWAFVAILFHELGHAWAYRRYGLKPRIRLYMLGGLAMADANSTVDLNNKRLLFIALAGPLASMLMGVVLVGILIGLGQIPHVFLTEDQARTYPIFFSLGWGILNLIPILPLDGGHVLQQLLAFRKSWPAEKITIWVSIVLGVGIAIYLVSQGSWWNAMLIGFLLSGNFQRLGQVKDDKLGPQVGKIQALIKAQAFDEAIQALEGLLEDAQTQAYRGWAMQTLAVLLVRQGKRDTLRSLTRYSDYEEFIPELKAQILLEEEGVEVAYTFARKKYAISPAPGIGLMVIDLIAAKQQWAEIPAFLKTNSSLDHTDTLATHASERLYKASQYEMARDISEGLFTRTRKGIHAYNVACALIKEDRLSAAISWLQKAWEGGFTAVEVWEQDRDLDPVRTRGDFQTLLQTVKKH